MHRLKQSLQRLSSSASNNRLKTCLQFLIIKVNEKSIPTPSPTTDEIISGGDVPKLLETVEQPLTVVEDTKYHQTKRQKSYNQLKKQRHQQRKLLKQKDNQLASPPQDQVSSTQDQVELAQDDLDCQTSPIKLIVSQIDDINRIQTLDLKQLQDSPTTQSHSFSATQSSLLSNNCLPTTTHTSRAQTGEITDETLSRCETESNSHQDQHVTTNEAKDCHNSDQETSTTASWFSSYASPPSPRSTSTSSSNSPSSSSPSTLFSPSPLASPDIINELRGPRLKLTDCKIRKIKRRPVLFDDEYTDESFVSSPATSSGCSPGQHPNTTQNSEHRSFPHTSSLMIHVFQAPPKFINPLKPCTLPTKPQKLPSPIRPSAPTKELLNCAICGIKDRPPTISRVYGQNSCSLCSGFFTTFLSNPRLLYCAQDGDCLMTFDSRCQACWIKICLQKFEIDDEHRKIGFKFSPKLLSSPSVSLITIDTSLT